MTDHKGIFNAIVKDNTDKLGMGRVRVYIPEFGGDPTDENNWYLANPVSPQAGATNPYKNTKGGKTDKDSQDAYGMWATGYHLENEVLITFINGDKSKAVVLGAMFGQNMTNSVAGYPAAKSHQGTTRGVHPPTVEYNKRDEDINPRNPIRPRRQLMSQQLKKQGLYRDFLRGQMSTSPHRDLVPQFTSMKTPRGNTFIMDDGRLASDSGAGVNERNYTHASTSHGYIRTRSAKGAQIYLNDNCGFVYMNTADGNAFQQIADDAISLYSASNLSMRAKSGISIRVDGDYNLEVLGSSTMKAMGKFVINTNGNFNIHDNGSGIIYDTSGSIDVKASGNASVETNANHSKKAGSSLVEQSGGNLHENTVTPQSVPDASEVLTASAQGREQAGCNAKTEEDSSLPSGSLVTHEPTGTHGGACAHDGGAPGINCGPVADQELSNGSTSQSYADPPDECGDEGEGEQDYPDTPSDEEIVEVVDAGPGWTEVRKADGSIERREGARNWRNNNPGNIEYGDYARRHGAVGSDGRFAVFPSYEQGRAAKENLLFNTSSYRDKTIAGAIHRYAPPSENNTNAYIGSITRSLGVSANTPLSSLTPTQRSAMLDAMERVEGFKVGRVYPR